MKTTRTFKTRNSNTNNLSYFGLIDARLSASDKEQPVQQQQQEHKLQEQEDNYSQPLELNSVSEQLLVNSSGDTVLLQSGGGLSFGFTAMEIPNTTAVMQRPASVMQTERPSSRSSNSSRR